jgi:hypothetical protein
MLKEDADKRRRRAGERRIEAWLYVAPRRCVHRPNVDDLRGPQPVLIGGTVRIMQLEVKL